MGPGELQTVLECVKKVEVKGCSLEVGLVFWGGG